ncbi:response regulator [Dyella koreensis]|uniref:Response regulator transcription factor n=1 Tax=Dyella koreensis TaxID=311235 RepID=A0ABW8JZG6_9GAMM
MSIRIILADDHPVVRIGTRAVIEASGVGDIVAEASNVDELLSHLGKHPCDVLVTDLSMPGSKHSDGYTMMERIRRSYPTLPILMLSVSSNVGILRMVSSLGVLGLIDKGSSMNELPVAIQTVHKGSSYISGTLKRLASEMDVSGMSGDGKKPLSPREIEVLRLIASGLKVKQIADQLNRGVTTISKQKSDAMRKIGIRNDAELFDYLRRQGFSS